MLENWLAPVSVEKIMPQPAENYTIGKQITIYADAMPALQDIKIALIGVGESAANAVRRAFYQMSYPFAGLKIADLGNVRKAEIPFMIPLLKELLDSQILPVIIASEASFSLAQYKAFQSLQSHISYVTVDERAHFRDTNRGADESFYLNDVFFNTRARLYHFGVVGIQAHFTPASIFSFLDKNLFDAIRLGSARADMQEIEPIIRDADLLSFHLDAIRQTDAPAQKNPTPSGFFLEEACQICRYAGMSDKLSSFGVFGFQQHLDQHEQTSQAIAQMIWYFLDGFYNRKNDFPISTDELTEYIVDFKGLDYQLVFWKSQKSGRWWMQVPVKISKKYQRHKLIPCSYNDYKLACQDELPDRLLNAYRRFL